MGGLTLIFLYLLRRCLLCTTYDDVAYICILFKLIRVCVQANMATSNVMWFNVKRLATSPPPILLNSVPLSSVQKQKYLGVTFDTNLNWSSHVASVCRSMSYYLHLINCHVKSLPSDIIKMLVESLVFSRYTYALSVWGPAIH